MFPKPEPESLPDQPPLPPVDGNGRLVRCYSCGTMVTVGFALSNFSCPACQTVQAVSRPSKASVPRYGKTAATGPAKARANRCCPRCKTMINVPPGVRRPPCPNCDINTNGFYVGQEKAAVDMEQEDDEGGMVTETFTDYRPSRISIGPLHPDPVVETSSLSAMTPPEPTYDLKTKDLLERSKALSCLQIEAVVYASQRHLQHLQDGSRAGFLIGDGAGVGKGRTIAGLIWENWHHGRTKALWVSVGSDLKFDTRRDLDDVGATLIEVHALNKLPYVKLDSESAGVTDGVIFLTYSSLIATSTKGYSRLEQLVEWCGPGYDGLIIFDECHKAKNLVPEAGQEPTKAGEAVVKIQELLPEARVVYCSATGASESRNMAYMVRLGLWGDGTCFASFTYFSRALEQGGLGALELVAMDMKARGMYLCRTLSYKGAEFEVVEAPLEASMVEIYRAATEIWVELRKELLRTDKQSRQMWRSYWAIHQLFFRSMCMAAKVPAIVRVAKQALDEGKSVVIGLQSTGEARTEDAVAKYGTELDDFVSGPRELLLKFVGGEGSLSGKPGEMPGKGNSKKPKRKRNLTTPGVSSEGRVQKAAKVKVESEEEQGYEFHGSKEDLKTHIKTEPIAFVNEFQNGTCEMCFSVEGMNKLLQCSSCGQISHPTCLVPPLLPAKTGMWTCYSCAEEPDEDMGTMFSNFATVETDSGTAESESATAESDSEIVGKICSLDLPKNPLDDIIDQLGGPDKVAEITGRRGRLVRTSGGEGVTYQARNTSDVSKDMVNMHEKQQFMDGNKLIAIISEAGSAGVSLQADRRAANQRRRVHLTLELPWSADRAIQQFGRTHRSNQASAPQYRLLFSNLGGERRFAATVAKRLESLGALTQGDRRAGPSLSAYNYVSFHGKKALRAMYDAIMEKKKDNIKATFPVPPPGCSFERPDSIKDFIRRAKDALLTVGIIKEKPKSKRKSSENPEDPVADSEDSGEKGISEPGIADSDKTNVERFLNRLLGMPPEIQNSLFELFVATLEHEIQNARFKGTFDKGIIEFKAKLIKLRGTPKNVYVDRTTGAPAVLYTFKMDSGVTWEAASALLDAKQKSGSSSYRDGFYESNNIWGGRRHYLLALEGSTPGMYKIIRPYGEIVREMPLKELKEKYLRVGSLTTGRTGWDDEYNASSEHCLHGRNCRRANVCTMGRSVKKVNVLGGVILPIWGAVEKALSKERFMPDRRMRIRRVVTTDGSLQIVGLFIPNTAIEYLLQELKFVEFVDDN